MILPGTWDTVYTAHPNSLTKTQDTHVNRRSPPKDSEKLYFDYSEKTMQCLEYKVKNPNKQPKQTKTHKKQLLSLAAISVVFGFLFIIQSLALLNKVNIASKILSSLEKLFDEKFSPTVSEGMSYVYSFQYIIKSNIFKMIDDLFLVQAFFLLPNGLAGMIHIHPYQKLKYTEFAWKNHESLRGDRRRFYTKYKQYSVWKSSLQSIFSSCSAGLLVAFRRHLHSLLFFFMLHKYNSIRYNHTKRSLRALRKLEIWAVSLCYSIFLKLIHSKENQTSIAHFPHLHRKTNYRLAQCSWRESITTAK